MLKILHTCFPLMCIVDDLVASGTTVPSTMLGSLRKQIVQMKKLWRHFLLYL